MRRWGMVALLIGMIALPLAALYLFWRDAQSKVQRSAVEGAREQVWPVLATGDFNEFVAIADGELQQEITEEEFEQLTDGLQLPDLNDVRLDAFRVEYRGAEAWHMAEVEMIAEGAIFDAEIVREATRPNVWRIYEIERTDR